MDSELLKPLMANGPWALMSGYLLIQILKAWGADRASVTDLLGTFKESIDSLKISVDKLATHIDMQANRHRAGDRDL